MAITNKAKMKYIMEEFKRRESPQYGLSSWERVYSIKEATSRIDYGCDFKDGVCKRVREEGQWGGREENKSMCCCANCESSRGYLHNIPQGKSAEIASFFDLKTGFWREGKGCILPRKYRSETCLLYCCDRETSDSIHDLVEMALEAARHNL